MRPGATRVLAGTAGVALMGFGASLLLEARDLTAVLVWLGGALVLHDLVIAPLVLLAGLVLVRGGVRGTVRGALVVAGALTAVAVPVLLRPGQPADPSLLPLNYLRNWLILLVAVATLAVLAVLGAGTRRVVHRRRRPSS